MEDAEIALLVRWIVKSWAAMGLFVVVARLLASTMDRLGEFENGEGLQYLFAMVVLLFGFPFFVVSPLLPLAAVVAIVGLPTFLLVSLALAKEGTDVRRLTAGCVAALAVWAAFRFVDFGPLIEAAFSK